jgi:hypothetical protein
MSRCLVCEQNNVLDENGGNAIMKRASLATAVRMSGSDTETLGSKEPGDVCLRSDGRGGLRIGYTLV